MPEPSSPANSQSRLPAFDILRIAAALGVIYSHSFKLLGHPEPTIVARKYSFTLGILCVGLFFTISGYLVSASWVRHPRPTAFARKRFARIWPGLIVCLILTALILGPFLTSESSARYFGNGRTWTFIEQGARLRIQAQPPGLFRANPLPGAVNGSLWTLPYEVLAYIVLLAVGVFGGLRRKSFVGVAAAGMLIAFEMLTVNRVGPNPEVYGMELHTVLMLGSWFAAGAFLFSVRWTPGIRAAMASIVAAATAITVGSPMLFVAASSVLFVWLGTRPAAWAVPIQRAGDPSFGMYIYAFPVQQTLVAAGLTTASPKTLFVVAAPIAAAIGYLSWHVVERRCLVFLRPRRRQGSGASQSDARGRQAVNSERLLGDSNT